MTEAEILHTLDCSNDGKCLAFIELSQIYNDLIDCRLTVFRGTNDRWAIVAERLGYEWDSHHISSTIYHFGNCLKEIKGGNGNPINWSGFNPVDDKTYYKTNNDEFLKPKAASWNVRNTTIALSRQKQDYLSAGITLRGRYPNNIRMIDAARLAAHQHPGLFRATEKDLRQYLPDDMEKFLVLDEWYHKDFLLIDIDNCNADEFREHFPFVKEYPHWQGKTVDQYIRESLLEQAYFARRNREAWANRPSTYETWQLIAKAIVANDPALYQPTLAANTHWSNWPTWNLKEELSALV
ncbi:DUF7003 family protein [Flavihumibacter petaseus]|uniref:Uncharacterized protein n=1 Tax=Flavihumibacter petaseus NBRC 106054 TaxID=1220578 RepID=A0A0E9MYX1_9BACT|nr:hypothetical protein [Flavihumibacter petaseus]GAO42310.1 hypothetical protein FPE01S_01_13230 [Flavihumibacter petaseus NBRC 106054]